MGLVHSRRRDFGQQRVQIKLMARETFSSLLNVVLDLRWFAEKGLPGLVKGLSRGIEKVRNNRVIGWLAGGPSSRC